MPKTSLKINAQIIPQLFGKLDENVKHINELFGVNIVATGEGIVIDGDKSELAAELIKELCAQIGQGILPDYQKISYFADLILSGEQEEISALTKNTVFMTARGKRIYTKTKGQRDYVAALRKNTVTFAIGPAGTGKTYLAVAVAAAALKSGDCDRLILTRPVVEAGEKLGFLPGDLTQKIDPYLRPLYDALHEMLGDIYIKYVERGTIEIAPLAYMRGRTLNKAFIILDEAQNTTDEQMKMFLTRLGEGSKMAITGDITQIDLPFNKPSGLVGAAKILNGIKDIAVVNLTARDVVRHELVMRIVRAYESR